MDKGSSYKVTSSAPRPWGVSVASTGNQMRGREASGSLVGGEATLDGMTAPSYGTNGSPSTEEHLAQLRAAVRALEGQLCLTESTPPKACRLLA